jgi:hypothetical protein
MHDRLKRTARKRGNYLRAKPIIEAHMKRIDQAQAERFWSTTPNPVEQAAKDIRDRHCQAARRISPEWIGFLP